MIWTLTRAADRLRYDQHFITAADLDELRMGIVFVMAVGRILGMTREPLAR